MGTKCIIGIAMIGMLFLGIFVWMGKEGGWKAAASVFGIVAAIIGYIVVAAYLLASC